MATKLRLYKAAARHCEQRQVTSLTETTVTRRALDDIYDDGFLDGILEDGDWEFAMRFVKIEENTSVEPSFGYQKAFDRPSDFVRLNMISADEYLQTPLRAYRINPDYFFADIDPLYLRYVSNDSSYGGDLSNWTQSVNEYAGYKLAKHLAVALNLPAGKIDRLDDRCMKSLKNARTKDAILNPTKFRAEGRWASAKRGSRSLQSETYGAPGRVF